MKEQLRVLERAAEGSLPEKIDSTSGLSLEAVQELVDAGFLKAIDASSFEGLAYLRPKITLAGREYLGRLTTPTDQGHMPARQSGIRLFISHSSMDSELAGLLVALLRAALNLPASQIRCTSIDGCRLPVGANTDEQLRRELHEADAFIGIISSESLKSLYVAFELGARWGAGRPLFPVLSPGTETSILGGPLAGINALASENRAQLHQLVTDLSLVFNIRPEAPAAYEQQLDAIVNLNRNASTTVESNSAHSVAGELSDLESRILRLIAKQGDYKLQAMDIVKSVGENKTTTEYHIDNLLEREFIDHSVSYSNPTTYGLTKKGRAYLVERSLV